LKLLLLLAAAALPSHPGTGIPAAANAPASFSEAAAPSAALAAPRDGRWWTIFADPQLDALIERGRAANADIAVAAARVSLARAALRGAEAERLPRIGGMASVGGQSGTLINAAGGTGAVFQLGAGIGYEVDLLGRLSKNARAARLDARAAAETLAGVRLIAEADIAQTYFTLRALDAELLLLEGSAVEARDAVAIAERRQRDGFGTALDVERLRGELGTVQVDRLALERERAAASHALALLVGDEGPVALAPWTAPAVPEIPAGLPSEMLVRRADVAASVDAIEAARLRLRATKAAWFPSFGLTASGGQASTSLADLLSGAARTFGFNLLLALPIFDGGRHKAAVRKSQAELELGEAQSRQIVLKAFREVDDQLSAVRLLAAEEDAARQAAGADARARALAERRFAEGNVSRLDLIDIVRAGLASQRRLSQLRHARYVATVNLIRALGGGWSGADAGAPLALNGSR
jgi:multidrug efflux system outer membrane protein